MEKIKQFIESDKGKDILTVIIVILVGLGSFGLGRLSKSSSSPGIKILPAQAGDYPAEMNNQAAAPINSLVTGSSNNISSVSGTKASSGNFFASNRGSKYYPLGCSAGKDLKMENRVYFDTREAAEAAGYQLSASCK